MVCQNCGKNEANVKYTQIVNGVKKEMVLCEECAEKMGISNFKVNMPIHFSNFFDDLFEFPFYDDRDMQKLEKKLYGRRGKNLMKTDIKDTDKAYELEMDLPGFKKDEIKVSLENGYLTISAARGLDVDEQEKETAKYIRKERYAGSCQRSFYVGEGVKQEDIKGEFKHGILKLVIPKKEEKPEVETSKYISIEG